MLNASKRATGVSDYVAAGTSGDGSWTRRVETVVRTLQARLGVGVDPVLIRTEVEAEFATYAAARVRQFVPILVESHVQARLRRQSGP
jgi:hypothetical protein